MSKRFIYVISAIYATLIICVSIAFHLAMNKNTSILRDALMTNNKAALIDKIEAVVDRLKFKKTSTLQEIKSEIESYNATSGDLLYVLLFTKTEDENFYKILATFSFRDELKLNIDTSAPVQEKKKINYLKKSLLHSSVDPAIYSQNGYHWQNIYYPYELQKKKCVLQFLVSVSRTQDAIDTYMSDTKRLRIRMAVITGVLVLAVIILTIVFIQNYSLLLSNLSLFMKKAADGDLEVSLKPTTDDELNQLASSFNTLIDELKEKTEKTVQEPANAGLIFNTGVALLKENKLDEAIAIFVTLTIIKSNGFGSYFNLGVAYAKKREYAKAIQMFENASRLNPSFEVTQKYIEKVKDLQKSNAGT